MVKKFCIITGSRAEYSHLYNLIKIFKKNYQTDIVVTGMHLTKQFGSTYKELQKDNINISERINLEQKSDYKKDICLAVSNGVRKFSKLFLKKKYTSIIILGDRYEIFSAAVAAYLCNIPICHIGGGDLSYGSLDDSLRHSITKMSYLHFASNKYSLNRILRMGEDKNKVFNVGTLSLDNLNKIKFLNKKSLERKLNIKLNKKNYILTYHPETAIDTSPIKDLTTILDTLAKLRDSTIIITSSNSDEKGIRIQNFIKNKIKKLKNFHFFDSLGRVNYFSLIKQVNCVLGNSSSGIIETPSFKVPSLNFGNRQEGRNVTKWTINCNINYKEILKNLKYIETLKFKNFIKNEKNFYYKKNSSQTVFDIIKKNKFEKIKNKK